MANEKALDVCSQVPYQFCSNKLPKLIVMFHLLLSHVLNDCRVLSYLLDNAMFNFGIPGFGPVEDGKEVVGTARTATRTSGLSKSTRSSTLSKRL